jgi:hypothetical protein
VGASEIPSMEIVSGRLAYQRICLGIRSDDSSQLFRFRRYGSWEHKRLYRLHQIQHDRIFYLHPLFLTCETFFLSKGNALKQPICQDHEKIACPVIDMARHHPAHAVLAEIRLIRSLQL